MDADLVKWHNHHQHGILQRDPLFSCDVESTCRYTSPVAISLCYYVWSRRLRPDVIRSPQCVLARLDTRWFSASCGNIYLALQVGIAAILIYKVTDIYKSPIERPQISIPMSDTVRCWYIKSFVSHEYLGLFQQNFSFIHHIRIEFVQFLFVPCIHLDNTAPNFCICLRNTTSVQCAKLCGDRFIRMVTTKYNFRRMYSVRIIVDWMCSYKPQWPKMPFDPANW